MDILGGRNANDKFYQDQLAKTGRLDLLDVRKAAYSNWLVNAITRIIGMRGLTWEDVAKATNNVITQANCTGKIDYKTKKQEQRQGNGESGSRATENTAPAFPPETVKLQGLIAIIVNANVGETPDSICGQFFKIKDDPQTYEAVKSFRSEKALNWIKVQCAEIEKKFSTILPPKEEPKPPEQDGVLDEPKP